MIKKIIWLFIILGLSFGIIMEVEAPEAIFSFIEDRVEAEDIDGIKDQGEYIEAELISETEIKEIEDKSEEIEEIQISLVGDILFDASIRGHIDREGYAYPYEYVKEYFLNDDLSIGNLETSITRAGEKWPDKQFNFRSDPKNLPYMKEAGIEVVSLANNHSLDYGYEGLIDSLDYLQEANIHSVGAGKNREEARKIVIIDKNNIKIGILGFSRVVPDVGWWATGDRPGLAGAYDGQLEGALNLIQAAKEEVDILIIAIHWGKELHEEPRIEEIIAAKKMIDSGADVIAGHHPHVLQGIEIYRGKPIFYSLGNFIFGSRSDLTANTMIAQLNYGNKDLKNIEIIPFNIVGARPVAVDEDGRREKLDYLQKISNQFGTRIEDGKIKIEE